MSRAESKTPISRTRGRRTLPYLLMLICWMLVVDAFVGENGLSAMIQTRRRYRALNGSLTVARAENARLREEARRLREDPAAIEDVARRDLGLIGPGEQVFIIRDPAASDPR